MAGGLGVPASAGGSGRGFKLPGEYGSGGPWNILSTGVNGRLRTFMLASLLRRTAPHWRLWAQAHRQ